MQETKTYIQRVRDARQEQVNYEADILAKQFAQTVIYGAARGDQFTLLATVENGKPVDEVLATALTVMETNGITVVKDEGKLCTYYLATWNEQGEVANIPALSTAKLGAVERVLTAETLANELVGGLVNKIHTECNPSNTLEYDFAGPFATPETASGYHVVGWLTTKINDTQLKSDNVVFKTSYDDNSVRVAFSEKELDEKVAAAASPLFKSINLD